MGGSASMLSEWTDDGTNLSPRDSGRTVLGTNINLTELGTPTYDDVQDWSNLTQSAGVVNGFTITDSGSGEIDIAAGQGILKTTDSVIGANVFFDYAGATNVSLTDNSINWVYIDYNAGTPQEGVTTDWTTLDLHTQIIIGKVYRMGTTVFIQETRQELDDVARRIMQMNYEKDGALRTSGMVLGETGTRNVTVTAGVFYEAWSRITTSAIDTSGADTFDVWNSSASTTADASAQTQYDNTQYWDGGALATLTNNRYGTRFFYLDEDGGLHMQYGTSNAAAAAVAENEDVPTPPSFLGDFGIYIGRIVVQKSAASATVITSSFTLAESGQVVTDHGNLAGLSDDDHTQYGLLVGRSGGQTYVGGTDAGDDLTLQTTSNASKGSYIFSELTTANGILRTDGSGVVTSSVDLPDGTTATTQSANDNSTKLATTAYADAAAPSVTDQQIFSTIFETSGRFAQTSGNGGSNTFGTQGVLMDTSATQAGYATLYADSNPSPVIITDNSQFCTQVRLIEGTDHEIYVGCGKAITSNGTANTTNVDVYGFEFNRASSSTTSYAHNATGVAETTTDMSVTTFGGNDRYYAKLTASTNIVFYVEGTLKATHTTNLPNGDGKSPIVAAICNANVASQTVLRLVQASYQQDAL